MSEFIYSLYHYKDGIDKKVYFYVGRSEREQGIRFKEHQYAAGSVRECFKTEVYEYIRNEVLCQIFEEEVLCVCEDENPQDHEDFWVIKLIREGHNLRNEKHGDQKRIAALQDAYDLEVGGVTVETVQQLREYRARKASERSQKLREDVLGTGTNPHPNPAVQEFLQERASPALVEARTLKEARMKLRADWREQEYQRWLTEQRHLFEQGNNKND
jgi:hypothetical protein